MGDMIMKTTCAVLLCVIAVCSCSCTDEDKVAAAIQGGEELNEGDPSPIALLQNYPNPFYSSTSIQYRLSDNMHVTLKVLTEDWQEVATLVDRVETRGYYVTEFHATDLPSGEYYYTLEGGGVTLIRRMAVLK